MIERPFHSLRSTSFSQLVLTCEHASKRLPRGTETCPESRKLLATHWGWDPGAWPLTKGLSQAFDASAVGGYYSRLFLDLNRQVGDPTLIRTQVESTPLPWNRKLGVREVEERLLKLHVPYHGEIDRLLIRRLLRGVDPFLFAVHTFTPRLGRSRRDYEIGVLYTDRPRAARVLGRGLEEAGLSVRYNQPYSGLKGLMYAADRHGSHHQIPCLELEVNQAAVSQPACVERILEALCPALDHLLGWLRRA